MQLRKNATIGAAIVLLVALTALVAGCAPHTQSDEEVVAKALSQELDQYTNPSPAKVNHLSEVMDIDVLEPYGISGDEFVRTYLDGFGYHIDAVEVEEETARVTVTISCKSPASFKSSLEESLAALSGKNTTLSDYELKELYKDAVLETLENTPVADTEPFTITYTKSGNTWNPEASAPDTIFAAMMSN